ncbi:MgtC/SapB family protein [Spirochaeta africana]|uniref:Putative membrane protein n=1 Tax=Spirochaeta africana (strain ATCC 700263 / DSM 8902 / Z-7692) TaxID=889378 RepID=H9UH01_SPIAZ|nr:MgtC/SapB family protein [Spirochaeta africana]AFG36794.1 putative membrane protein [Spirochaeta africana DSM 8902]
MNQVLGLPQALLSSDPGSLQFFFESALRLVLALVFGGAIGWERERHSQPAGLRTHMLICMGAALVMVLSAGLTTQFPTEQGADPGRIAAQVISGIGFIGGGAILRLRGSVKGITTAASLWVAAGLGLTVGAGMYATAVLATALIIFTLGVLTRLEVSVINPMVLRRLEVSIAQDHIATEHDIRAIIDRDGLRVLEEEVDLQLSGDQVELSFQMRMPMSYDISAFTKAIGKLNGVRRVRVRAPR